MDEVDERLKQYQEWGQLRATIVCAVGKLARFASFEPLARSFMEGCHDCFHTSPPFSALAMRLFDWHDALPPDALDPPMRLEYERLHAASWLFSRSISSICHQPDAADDDGTTLDAVQRILLSSECELGLAERVSDAEVLYHLFCDELLTSAPFDSPRAC